MCHFFKMLSLVPEFLIGHPKSHDPLPGAGWGDSSERWLLPPPLASSGSQPLSSLTWSSKYLPGYSPRHLLLNFFNLFSTGQPEWSFKKANHVTLWLRYLICFHYSWENDPNLSFYWGLYALPLSPFPGSPPLCFSFTSWESMSYASLNRRDFANAIPLPGKLFSSFLLFN